MKNRLFKCSGWIFTLYAVLPFFFLALFFVLRGNKPLMDFWVFNIAGPFEQFLGRLCSFVPFSVVELLTVAAFIMSILFIISAAAGYFKDKNKTVLLKRISVIAIFWLWIIATFYWLWNVVYYASSFSERSNLQIRSCSVEELAAVTDYFAYNAAELSDKMKRDEKGIFDENLQEIIESAPENYKAAEKLFPFLQMDSVKVKPFAFSRLQSMLGFTGMYTPYTGEANINTDVPKLTIPSTICHEMTHQRMVAPEDECNFVGITACILSDDIVYQYSGYFSGLIHLSNALFSVSPDAWQQIAEKRFTKELYTDWIFNADYWEQFESPVQEISSQVYDGFLKHNKQELGNRSYGACVDLIISYFLPKTENGKKYTPQALF